MSVRRFLVTGGAGFIGSAVIRHLIENTPYEVVNVDKLTYAGNLDSLTSVSRNQRYRFERVDICDGELIRQIFEKYEPDVVLHLAAESHVDRSIDGPQDFIQTNLVGTFTLLETARLYWSGLSGQKRTDFRFHHVSTDEVYGDLEGADLLFTEDTSYAPSSPYSATKAGSDHLVRAWGRTYDLPIIITNCSNNYGPFQFPEKLIPRVILNAIQGKVLPVYGDGGQVRDWLYVEDHARALVKVAESADIGETFNIGGHNEVTNLAVVRTICGLLDDLMPDKPVGVVHYADLIRFVPDRPGHDRRYAIDASKIERALGWVPSESFESGLRQTVVWYLDNQAWWSRVLDGGYRLKRLGFEEAVL